MRHIQRALDGAVKPVSRCFHHCDQIVKWNLGNADIGALFAHLDTVDNESAFDQRAMEILLAISSVF